MYTFNTAVCIPLRTQLLCNITGAVGIITAVKLVALPYLEARAVDGHAIKVHQHVLQGLVLRQGMVTALQQHREPTTWFAGGQPGLLSSNREWHYV